jgi:carboxypeptidase Taq
MTEQSIQEVVSSFKDYVKKIMNYREAVGLLLWDMRTGAPKKGLDQRSQTVGMLSAEMFKMSVSPEMDQYLTRLTESSTWEGLDDVTRKMVTEAKKEFDQSKLIPPKEYEEFVILRSKAESVWEEARANNDFALFQPYLEKLVATMKRFVDYWGSKGDRYDTLLDIYEPGMTVEMLDALFADLREKTINLLQRIQASPNKPQVDFLYKDYDRTKQKEFSLFILKEMGYDFGAGRLDETAHPFATGLNPGDVRVTTRFYPNDLRAGLFGTIHEGGHALYEQNVSSDLIGTNLCEGTSMGIHESQSRYWENGIGRSKPFWERYYDQLLEMFPEQLSGVSMDAFHRAVNEVTPSLIRVEADELTYNLHIMIRYELEKGLLNGRIEVADLPKVWNAKYEEYLGITPDSDANGVLQDVHWSAALFGYFPSYSLGNIYAAQIAKALEKDILNLDELIREGNLLPVKEWLKEKIHRHGKLKNPSEILEEVTGESINSGYLVEYLTKKYTEIYDL